MTTKEQELKALEKIEKIVSELGEDSYVGTAFEGCFDIARQNIENDWACSWKQVADSNVKAVETLQKQVAELSAQKDALKELSRKELKEALDKWGNSVNTFKGRIKELKEQYEKAEEARQKALDRAIDERREVKIDAGNDWDYFGPFKTIKFYRNEGSFPFVNVEEPSGWTRSFKIEDIKEFIIG